MKRACMLLQIVRASSEEKSNDQSIIVVGN